MAARARAEGYRGGWPHGGRGRYRSGLIDPSEPLHNPAQGTRSLKEWLP
jgi:hypothetical protein